MNPIRSSIALFCIFSTSASLRAAEFAWEVATPASQAMSSDGLSRLKDTLAERNTKALLVIRNDKIVYEWYADGHGPAKRHYTASMAKALVGGVSLAAAMSKGRIALDDFASRFIPQWRDVPQKSKITIRQLGSHTSGIEDAETNRRPHNELTGWKGDFWKRLDAPRDPFTISRDVSSIVGQPGARFQYSNPGIGMLSYAITAALKGQSNNDLRSLLRDQVMRPIGVPDEEWSVGYGRTFQVDGLPLVAAWGGGSYSARAAARVGRLMLRKGNWDGKQVLSPEAVRLTTVDAGLPNGNAMGWWTNGKGLFDSLPKDAFWAAGAGHQVLLVLPSLNIICVRNGGLLDRATSESEYQAAKGRYIFGPLMAAVLDNESTTRPPYLPSSLISHIAFDWTTHTRHAPGSDNWQLTWADDGHQYAAWGDGGGFGGTNSKGRVSLGVVRIEGTHDEYRGVNVWGGAGAANPATVRGKSWAMVCVDGILYMWVSKGSGLQEMQAEARLYRSKDHGATWQPASWAFTREQDLTIPTICQFGQDYADARDEYVYHYFLSPSAAGATTAGALQNSGAIYLARSPRHQVMDRSAYEFYSGSDPSREAKWTADVARKKPVFQDPNGTGWCLSVSYNQGLRRYILITNHIGSSRGNLGVFDAREPWGPWSTVVYMNRSENTHFGHQHVADNVFFANIPTKWTSENGRQFTMVFTGGGRGRNNDSWNAVRARFVDREAQQPSSQE